MSDTGARVGHAEAAEQWGVTLEEYAAAISVVEEALRSAQHLLTAAETELLRDDLLAHLFGSPAGRQGLRSILERAAPDQSGDVPRGDALQAEPALRRRGGSKS